MVGDISKRINFIKKTFEIPKSLKNENTRWIRKNFFLDREGNFTLKDFNGWFPVSNDDYPGMQKYLTTVKVRDMILCKKAENEYRGFLFNN